MLVTKLHVRREVFVNEAMVYEVLHETTSFSSGPVQADDNQEYLWRPDENEVNKGPVLARF